MTAATATDPASQTTAPVLTLATGAAATIELGALPREADLVIYQGDTFGLRLTITTSGLPADLTGLTPASQIRRLPNSDTIAAQFNATITRNVIELLLPNEQSQRLTRRDGFWDARLFGDDGRVLTLLRGRVRVTESVTRQ